MLLYMQKHLSLSPQVAHIDACTGMPLKHQYCCIHAAQCLVPLAHRILAERDFCVHCTVHNTNKHMLKSFAQPGSQLKKICHKNAYIYR